MNAPHPDERVYDQVSRCAAANRAAVHEAHAFELIGGGWYRIPALAHIDHRARVDIQSQAIVKVSTAFGKLDYACSSNLALAADWPQQVEAIINAAIAQHIKQ